MARIGSKGSKLHVVSPVVAYALDKVSKAALIDLYVQALAANLGACDTAPTLEEVRADADPTLRVRGDRLVISEERVFARFLHWHPQRATSAKYVVEGSGAHLLTRETEETD